jgi:hypothetical protein
MKIETSALVNAMSGKLGGSVARRAKTGLNLGRKGRKPNFVSNSWNSAKARFSSVMSSWNNLTSAQVQAWNNLASELKGSNIFGNKFKYDGIAIFQRLNNNLVQAGSAIISAAPTLAAVVSILTFSATAVHAGDVTLTFTPDPIPAGSAFVVEATKAFKPGLKPKQSDFRQIAVLAAAEESPYTATTVYNAKFGSPGAAGLTVYFRLKAINTVTGQVGLGNQCSCVTT